MHLYEGTAASPGVCEEVCSDEAKNSGALCCEFVKDEGCYALVGGKPAKGGGRSTMAGLCGTPEGMQKLKPPPPEPPAPKKKAEQKQPEQKSQQEEKPQEAKKPVEAKKPDEAQKPAEAKKPDEAKKPVEANKPAEAKKPAEVKQTEEGRRPPETTKPEEEDADEDIAAQMRQQDGLQKIDDEVKWEDLKKPAEGEDGMDPMSKQFAGDPEAEGDQEPYPTGDAAKLPNGNTVDPTSEDDPANAMAGEIAGTKPPGSDQDFDKKLAEYMKHCFDANGDLVTKTENCKKADEIMSGSIPTVKKLAMAKIKTVANGIPNPPADVKNLAPDIKTLQGGVGLRRMQFIISRLRRGQSDLRNALEAMMTYHDQLVAGSIAKLKGQFQQTLIDLGHKDYKIIE